MKMNKKAALIIPGLMLCMILLMVSCQKEKSTINDPSDVEAVVSGSTEETVQDATYNEVFDDVAGIDDASAGEDLGLYGIDGDGIFSNEAAGGSSDLQNEPTTRCFSVTVVPKDKGVFPKTVTIDFGAGCEVRGHLRKGKIIIVYTGRLHKPGSMAVTKFENFYIDQFRIEGEHTTKNITLPGSNYRVFTTQIVDGKITNTDNGKWCLWNVFHTIKQTDGNGTPFFPKDDIFSITGTRKVECSDGKSKTSEITEALIKKFTCKWIVKGVVKITLNKTQGVLDYGDGSCDNKATITVDGVSRDITLR